MILQEMLKGESKNVEFKRELPEKSDKYIKSIIAFSNTGGGKLVVGIDDGSREIIGVDEKEVFRMMDQVANAISDSCEPQIIPNITFQTIENKCIVIIEIYPGANRPYYLKKLGKSNGTYIRISGTSRPADLTKIKELEIEGSNLSWDELACVGYEVTDKAVKKLCNDIQQYMYDSRASEEDRKLLYDVTVDKLLSWKVLKQSDDGLLATNSFALLTSDYFSFSKIQCALFKGKDRDVFIDKKEYTGALYEQIEKAYQFVLRHINLGAEIEGLVRRSAYEVPIGAIREMIVNAVCHRNYLDNSCVQVAIYDDRIEVTSPGMLYGGLTLHEAMNGRSKIRNRAIAEVLGRMEIVESWGTGIKRIINRAQEYGLPEPKFQEIGDTFRVDFYREEKADKIVLEKPIKKADKNISLKSSEKADISGDNIAGYDKVISKKPIKKADKSVSKKPINQSDRKDLKKLREGIILTYIRNNGSITNKEARLLLNLAESTTKRVLKQMVDENIISVQGDRKNRKYVDFLSSGGKS